jgi:hypothetical protein
LLFLSQQNFAFSKKGEGKKMTNMNMVVFFFVVMFLTLVVIAILAVAIYGFKTKTYTEKTDSRGKFFSVGGENWYRMEDSMWPVLHVRGQEGDSLRVLFVDLRWGELPFDHNEVVVLGDGRESRPLSEEEIGGVAIG